MSPITALLVLGVFVLAAIFLFGLCVRKRAWILVGTPGAVLLIVWYCAASVCPNPQREFDRLFGAENRAFASDIQTIKPTMMDGHFISFRIRPEDFDARIRPGCIDMPLQSRTHFLLGQRLPKGWPPVIQTSEMALSREVKRSSIYILYFPNKQRAYCTVQYEQW